MVTGMDTASNDPKTEKPDYVKVETAVFAVDANPPV